MSLPVAEFSEDQAEAFDRIAEVMLAAGVNMEKAVAKRRRRGKPNVVAVIGKAGSGKTLLLARLAESLSNAGVETVGGDYEGRRARSARTLAILAPTNKAASVLRSHNVPATTIHRILYTPVYDPEKEKIAEWLAGRRKRPKVEGVSEEALDRAAAFYEKHASIPGALAVAGVKASDLIKGWQRRDDPLDIGFVDEASMLDAEQFKDLQEIFPTLVLFGDPAQLAPVNQSGEMVFDSLPETRKLSLSRIHRQDVDNPVLELAHALGDEGLTYEGFVRMVEEVARNDSRVVLASRVDATMMARSPVLVWTNATRVRLIHAFRTAHDAPPDRLLPGEPLICDGIELPFKHRMRRLDLEARGLIKGAQTIYLGPGGRSGFARMHVIGTAWPQVSAASIIKIEMPEQVEPKILSAARMGATFLHGAAVTIHKAQGSQWKDVQVYAPDLRAAYRSELTEAGVPLWKRLAYVAITRAEERLHWVRRNRLGRPAVPLATSDLEKRPMPLALSAEEDA